MRMSIRFPKDPKNPTKGFREINVTLTASDLRECIEEAENIRERFVKCMADKIIEQLARDWCRAVGSLSEECIEVYMFNQGEAMRNNIESAIKVWIVGIAEILKKCGRNWQCVIAEYGTAS